MLERLGHRADVVANGVEAVRAVTAAPYDLVLMDVQMPDMDGLEATRRIRAQVAPDRQPRIVALTANAMSEDRDRCLDAGMDDYRAKPVRPEALAEAVGVAGGGRAFEPAASAPPPAAAPPVGVPAVDADVLRALTDRLGPRAPELRTRLLDTWEAETRKRLEELAAAALAGDADGVQRAAHTMKSGSAALGALQLAEECDRIEATLRSGEQVDLAAVAAVVERECARASAGFAALR
jgi:CheY-like chemotaxis protein/HPt (histidine-containing phosphotransfer) domain-containing protein